jgi:head-tail adaptor
VQIRPDGQGGVNEQWADLATVWARIETIKDSAHANIEKFEEMQVKYQQHYSITLRYRTVTPIDTSYRILYSPTTDITRVFNIIAVVNLDVLSWQTNLYVREGGNIG